MTHPLSRTELIYGSEALAKVRAARVAVFGLGGVGGNVVEALARSGIGTLDLIDNDTITLTNLNRQLLAVRSTLGQRKVDAAADRVHDINPDAVVHTYPVFFLPDNADQFDFTLFDYVVDAVDTVAAKLELIVRAQGAGTPILSCMGCGNRIDPARLRIADLAQTHTDPLARTMRRECKKRRIEHLKVLCSDEPPIRPLTGRETSDNETPPAHRRSVPGSTAFVPPAAGILIAAEVVRDLSGFDPGDRVKGGRQKR
ncbi:MAG: tRNA threonylcarbamoyladenosine dehydratase [Anaerovoracaceae bacterium]|jgi:tRNA A37 threonylcarbamoyladenosine dehydratase